ncbi:ABC transporter permease [Dehalobacter sp. DCM]|uniref:ABC transporter permease n=1 Tax=Dehalobacter sp. DCM TaxID=2907827 RepID=UPI003081C126|nr:ABC transporter permease [Dehalobacter sp. DCM]
MRLLSIIRKEFIQNIRNTKANIMMILFPIVLITILGAAFSTAFSNDIALDNVKVLYTINGDQELSSSFKGFLDDLHNEVGITFTEAKNKDAAISSIKNTEFSCYINLTEDPQKIEIIKNARFNFEANLVESLVKSFASRYEAISQIAQNNPSVLPSVLSNPAMDFVKIQSLDKKRQPGALDYYAVTMLTLILMYASQSGFWSIKTEKSYKTGNRMLCAPVNRMEILAGKTLGSIFVTVLQGTIVLLFSTYALKAYWGTDIPTIFLIIISEAILAVSLGTGIAYLIHNDGAGNAILNIIVPVLVFLGGGYFQLPESSSVLQKITAISPIKWTNDALFRVIYDKDYTYVIAAIAVNLLAAALFLGIAALFSKKEAV